MAETNSAVTGECRCRLARVRVRGGSCGHGYGVDECQGGLDLRRVRHPDGLAENGRIGRGADDHAADLPCRDPLLLAGDGAGADGTEDEREGPVGAVQLGDENLLHHQDGGLFHADESARRDRP